MSTARSVHFPTLLARRRIVPEETAVEEKELKLPQTGKSPIGKMLMIVVLALISSAGGGVISFMLLSKALVGQAKAAAENPAKAEQEKMAEMLEKGAVIPLEPFVVNLA